jgi:uncharacterized protein (TIGR03437 family)
MLQRATRFALAAAATALAALSQSANTNTIVGAGYVSPTSLQVAPGQVIAIFAAGVGSSLTQPVLAGPGNWPASLAGISVTIRQGTDMLAPILKVSPVPTCGAGCGVITAITIQIPVNLMVFYCSASLACPDVLVATDIFVTENGVPGTLSSIDPLPDQVHILTVCDPILPGGTGILPIGGLPCQPQVTHANGVLVSNTNPATVGEELVAYAVGLGATNPAVPSGQAASQPTPTVQTFNLDFNFHSNALPAQPSAKPTAPLVPLFTGLTPGYPGLYQINFVVPRLQSALPCAAGVPPPPGLSPVNTNLTVSLGGATSFDGAAICVSLSQ